MIKKISVFHVGKVSMNINQHHNKYHWMGEERKGRTLDTIESIKRTNSYVVNEVFNPNQVQRSCPYFVDDFHGYWSDALIMEWPKVHCRWLLAAASDLAVMDMRMHRLYGQRIEMTFWGKPISLVPEKSGYNDGLYNWLNAVCLAILNQDDDGVNELCLWTAGDQGKAKRLKSPQIPQAFFELFKAYIQNESDPEIQRQLISNVLPYLASGVIEKLESHLAEGWNKFMIIPLFSMVAKAWGADSTDWDTTVKSAMEANYDYFSYLAPQDGDEKGKNAVTLWGASAMIHHMIMAFSALHYRRTGIMVTFESDYIPAWVIKGEGPSNREVEDNPPIFELEAVL